jgi:4-hydroxy-tetrahydrodipicolinate synthase
MITPLSGRDKLDEAGLSRLIEHILSGGVHGLFVLGTTGEAPSLSHRLRCELIRRTCRQVAGRVPVLAGISDTSFAESVRVARAAAEAGADGLVVAPPYYFPAGQPELIEYLQDLVEELDLPLFLYNMPSHTKLVFECETVRILSELPGVVGLKDSSADLIYFRRLQQILRDREGFTLLIGPEELLAEAVLLGAHGGVSGGANLFPSLYVELYAAAAAGDLARAASLNEEVMQISETIYSVGRHGSSLLKGLKCALAHFGICSDFMAEPFRAFREPERRKIERALVDLRERWRRVGYDFSPRLDTRQS